VAARDRKDIKVGLSSIVALDREVKMLLIIGEHAREDNGARFNAR
jgi:hypothetical protein